LRACICIRLSYARRPGRSLLCSLLRRRPPGSTLFPYTTLFRSNDRVGTAERFAIHTRNPQVTGNPAQRRPLPRPEDDEIRKQQRSEEHTSELQSRVDLVCRLLLEKKKTYHASYPSPPGLACTPH